MTDEEILKAAADIKLRRDKEYRDEITARYLAEAEKAERRARAFAESIGVTWEQFGDIEDYVRTHLDD